jgi:hypothetical protein
MTAIHLVSGLVVSLLVCIILVAWNTLMTAKAIREFRERFPPISDAEFVARCAPGTNPRVALKVRRVVADNLGVEYARIYPSSRFAEALGVA